MSRTPYLSATADGTNNTTNAVASTAKLSEEKSTRSIEQSSIGTAHRRGTLDILQHDKYALAAFLFSTSLVLALAWYLNPERIPYCQCLARILLLQIWEWSDAELPGAVAHFLVLFKEILRSLSLFLLTLSATCFCAACYQSTRADSSSKLLENLTDPQRRLLGLENVQPKIDQKTPRVEVAEMPTPLENGSFTPLVSPSHPPSSAGKGRLPLADTTGGPSVESSSSQYLTPPPSMYRARATPTKVALFPSGGSGGDKGRPPRRKSGGDGAVSFGESADVKMKGLLDEMLVAADGTPVSGQQLTPQGRGLSASKGAHQFLSNVPISPLTNEVVGPYRESALGGAGGGLLGGPSGSPTERWDVREWPQILQHRIGGGLDVYKLSNYVDNLRETLYTEIIDLLTRFNAAVVALERCGVPLDLLLGEVNSTPSGLGLEDYLNQARGQWEKEVQEYTGLKRVLSEGEGWMDRFGHIYRRLGAMVQDSYLSSYEWSRGGVLRHRNVTVELPTDADLIMHVFLWRCDAMAEHRLHGGDRPFVKQHFLEVPPGTEESSRSLRGRNLIMRHGTSPPYFSVVENGLVHRIPTGKDNALVAIVVFLFLARRDRWLPKYNQGYRRLLEGVFGSAVHPEGGARGDKGGQKEDGKRGDKAFGLPDASKRKSDGDRDGSPEVEGR